MDRPNPGQYTPRERLLRVLRHEPVDRLPIVPTALTPFTWHAEFPDYQRVLEVAKRHCEFMASCPLNTGLGLCDPAILDQRVEKTEQGERKTHTTTLKTPKGELTEVRIHDRSVGSWATAKAFVNSEADLAAWESLPYQMVRPDLSAVAEMDAKIGPAGLPYINGISDALNLAVHAMGEEFRIMFCFGEKDHLRRMVDLYQQRLLEFVEYVLAATSLPPPGGRVGERGSPQTKSVPLAARPPVPGAGDGPAHEKATFAPVFRWYAIEPFVEPIQPPRFIDQFVVPFDREIIKLIHSRGRHVVTHCHGRLKAQISRMVQIGFDGVDCVESPPANDATLAEMFALAEGRLFLWGYIQFEDLAHKSGDEIEAMVRDAVAMGGATGRYVLGQAASPWSSEISPQTQDNWIRMIEAGVKYGGR